MVMKCGRIKRLKKQEPEIWYSMYNKKEQFRTLLFPLYFFLQLARKAYTRYSANKIYLHAATLRLSNRKVYRLLVSKAAYIPAGLQDDTLELLHHYDTWFTQFRDHKKKLKPSPGEEFIFRHLDEQSAFPRAAEERIMKYYEMQKQELANETLPGQ